MSPPRWRPSRVYVATKFENAPAAREAMAALRAAGLTITHDWTAETLDGVPESERVNHMHRCGLADFAGVVHADALVMLEHPACRDTLVEVGIALGSGTAVYVVGSKRDRSVFWGLVTHCESVDEAVRMITEGRE